MRNKSLKEGWTSKKLEELGFLGRGKSKHRPRNDPSLYGGRYPFIQTGEVKEADLYIGKYSKTYNEKGLAQSKLWKSGTLLLTIAANVAETAILKVDACFPDSIAGFIANPQIADARFIKYYIDTIKLQMQSISRGTTQDNLSLEKIRSFDFLVPPLPTQQKIAAILSAYDDLIENNNRRIEILEEMARMLYREWFVKFRYPGHESDRFYESELGLIPEGWEVVKLGDVYKTTSGGTPSRKKPEYYGGSISWIKTKELEDKFILETEEKITELGLKKSSAKLFPEKTVVMAMYGATIGKLGILASSSTTNQACCAILTQNNLFSSYYIFLYLLENREKIFSLGMGAAQQNISQQVIRNFDIFKPKDLVLEKFNALVEAMFNSIKVLQQKNNNLRQTRDLLLPRLISGEIDVENLDIKVIEN